jgi:hypothetical protein
MHAASSTSSAAPAVTVTGEMLYFASLDGNLEQLREWARQNVRATTGRALRAVAVLSGFADMGKCLVQELGADVK